MDTMRTWAAEAFWAFALLWLGLGFMVGLIAAGLFIASGAVRP